MPYQAKSRPFYPKSITGISEKVLVSHYENNHVGAVKRLNAVGAQRADGSCPRNVGSRPILTARSTRS